LIFCPLRAPSCHVGTVAFAGHQAFFEAEFLGVDELPDRAIIDLEAALGQLGHQPAQGEVPFLDPPQQPQPVLTPDFLRLVAAHLARRYAAGLAQAPDPIDGGADRYAEVLRCPIA
jgi:hypothetical protein